MPTTEPTTKAAPLVTVLMPVYNAERYIAEATESILGQTFTDFEFVIIDDGSKDRSLPILEGYAARDARIKLVSRPNTGVVKALNEGLGLARGDLVARMDADDVALPQRLAKQIGYLEAHPECVMVASRVQLIDPDGMPLIVQPDALTHEQIVEGLLARRGQLVYHPSVVYRKRIVLEIGAYREIFDEAEDLDLFLRLAEVGRVVNLEEPLLEYREHLAKTSRTRVARVEANIDRILEDAHRRRGLAYSPTTIYDDVKRRPPAEVYRNWSWWALGSGNLASARKHAMACLARTPFTLDSWKLFYCAIRGR
jgi:glycosyltransferase involved in cell wall biosynthesis